MIDHLHLDFSKHVVLSGTGNFDLASRIIKRVNEMGQQPIGRGLSPGPISFDDYPDGEPAFGIVDFEELKNRRLILFQSMESEKLVTQFLQLCFSASRQYGVSGITAVVPFLRYRRQDHPEIREEIDRNRFIIDNLASNGVDELILCEPHSDQTLKNCKRAKLKLWVADPSHAFAEKLRLRVTIAGLMKRKFFVYVPDEGAIPRGLLLAKDLGVKIAFTPKVRLMGDMVRMSTSDKKLFRKITEKYGAENFVPLTALRGQVCCIYDDELSTAGTAITTGKFLLHQAGVAELYYCATHPVCAPGWKAKMIGKSSPFSLIMLGDTLERDYEKSTNGRIIRVSMSPTIAEVLYLAMLKH